MVNDGIVSIFKNISKRIDNIIELYQEEKETYKDYDPDELDNLSVHSYFKFEKILESWNRVLDYMQSKLELEEVIRGKYFAPDLIPFLNKKYIDFQKSILSEPYLVIDLRKMYNNPLIKPLMVSDAITCIGYDYITPITDCGIYFKIKNGDLCAGIFDLKKANEIVDGYKRMRSECERDCYAIKNVCDPSLSEDIHMVFTTLVKILNLSNMVYG